MCEENKCACATKDATTEATNKDESCKPGEECSCSNEPQETSKVDMDSTCKDGVCQCKSKEESQEDAK